MKLRVALILSFALAGPSVAVACINSMRVEGDDAVKQIANAERLLAKGDIAKAERLVSPDTYQFSDKRLRKKASMVNHTAGLRRAKVAKYRIDASTRFFAEELKNKPEDPLLVSRHAEALALSGKTAAKARATLEDLAERDLMPEAQSYTVLAQLLSEAGEKAAADKAVASCLKMTKHKAVCSLTPKVVKKPRSKRSRAVVGGFLGNSSSPKGVVSGSGSKK
tara:strand:- start:98449 stop:99114 length:666 start_codon:yes stop_codon:yes gene_type:complete